MASPVIPVRVDCHAGHRGEETPRALRLGTRRVGVRRVLDRWLAPDHRYFKVLGEDGDVYIVRHDPNGWRWELTYYRAAGSAAGVRFDPDPSGRQENI